MKRIVAFILIFVLLMTSACTKPNDEESAESIDTNVGAEQPNNNTDNAQIPDTNEPVNNQTEQNKQPVQNNTQKEDNQPNTSTPDNQQKEPENKVEEPKEDNKTNTTTPDNQQKEPENKVEEPEEDNKTPVYDDSNATPASDFEYTMKKDDTYIILKNYIGNKKDVVTPNYIDGYPVKAIAVTCFANTCVENIVISENIEIISPNAFSGSYLKTATIKSKSLVAYLYSFEGCTLLESVTFMYGDAEFTGPPFFKCPNLKEIVFLCDAPKCATLSAILPENSKTVIKYKKDTKGWDYFIEENKQGWNREFVEIN